MALEDTSGTHLAGFPFANRLFASLPLGIVLQDDQGRITQANAAAERILGLTFDQMRGATSVDPRFRTVHDDGGPFPGEDHPAMQALRTGETVANVIMGVFNPTRDAFTWIRIDAVPLKDENGAVVSVYTIFKDITERREALLQRDASERRFQALFTAMSEGMALHRLVKDAHGKPLDYLILDVNPAFEAQTGARRDQVIGQMATQAYAQPVAPYLDIYSQVATCRQPTSFESYFAPLDKCFRINVFSPEPDHFATVFEDVTDLKRFHEALRLQSQITSQAALGIALVLADGTLHYVNQRFEELFGYGVGELIGQPIAVINAATSIPPEATARLIMSALESRGVWSGQVLNKKKDGTTFWCQASVSTYDDPELGKVQIVYQSDITESKQAQQVIAQFETVFEHAGWGMVITNARSNIITKVNEAYAHMHGYQIGELMGSSLLETYAPEVRDQVAALAPIVHQRGHHRFESVHVRKDGSRFPCTLDVTAFRDDAGEVMFRAATIEDISERKRIEDALRSSEQRYRLLAENSHDVIWTLDIRSKSFTYVSPSVERLLGLTPAEVMSLPLEQALTPQSALTLNVALAQRLMRIAAGEEPSLAVVTEVDQPRRDGSIVHTEVVSTIVLDGAGQPATVLGFTRDITERKKAQEEQQLAALVYRSSSEAMVITDANNLIESVNPAFERITGYAMEEVKGKNPKVLGSGRQDQTFYTAMWRDLNDNGCWQGEIWNRRKDGECYLEQLSINTDYAADGTVYRRVALFSDITQKKEAVDLIWKQANFDALTQLPNRRMFRDRLEQEIKKANRASRQLALLFIDLDHFKEVNDTLGHVKGDQLIVEAARRVVASVRETDTIARMGGDEFTILLTDLDEVGSVERAALSVLKSLALPFHIDESVVYISASIGITLYPNDTADIDELLKNADQAMYVAKRAGRNRYSYFTQDLQEEAQRRIKLIADLHGAVSGQEMRVYFQPIIELASGRVSKAEALVRWQHPLRGLVSPAEFIPVAEETGLISDIGDWVFQEAMRWTARWREVLDDAFQVSVNRSPIEFANETSHDSWPQVLQAMGLPGASVVVEITEGVLVDADSPALAALVVYRDGGIQVSIDDFGTGYSSLSYLKKFDIDYLKIDQSFTRNLEEGSSDLALSKAIIVMAHALGLKVIAEGVETTAQRDLLLAAGCDYAQGYLFSRPLPPEAFEAWVVAAAK